MSLPVRIILVFATLLLLILLLASCQGEKPYHRKLRNLDPSVGYAGMNACISCHAGVHETFLKTGMGQSFGRATPQKSSGLFGARALVYDSVQNLYYYPFFRDSILYIREFRMQGKDTTHNRLEKVSYIIGSGHHTNSHILDINGYLYQAPITFYTQEGKWDLAPGFEKGKNSRFSRLLTEECITCHNHFPEQVPGSLNRYSKMPLGIQCERCHGPGQLHVREKLAGIIVDTSRTPDYSIVNPRRLPIDLQMDICQRCHLQGITVLNEGKTYSDFKPGMPLNSVMQVFLPRFTNSHEKFIMASQADRLRLSPCFLQSGKLSCISCHHPHVTSRNADPRQFNRVCQGCHEVNGRNCSAPGESRAMQAENCVSCHMPKTGTIDIPHVHITEHNIRKSTARIPGTLTKSQEKEQRARFLGLEMLTKLSPASLEMARGYVALFDNYLPDPAILDSALYHLNRSSDQAKTLWKETRIHILFAAGKYPEIIRQSTQDPGERNYDAWTYYRIGESFLKTGKPGGAVDWLIKAVGLMPNHLDFREKLGLALASSGREDQARKEFERVLAENPERPVSHNDLGFMFARQGKWLDAKLSYDAAIALDPDYVQALLNRAALGIVAGRADEAKRDLQQVLRINPQHQQAKAALASLRR